ncbi:RNA 2',3'-cyclic phosphodiesterase [bacterium]|nr:RNA 2',3'-cyclic phosphodiesterase [bacterium]
MDVSRPAAGKVRAFIAVSVPGDVRAAITGAARDAFGDLPHVRLVAEENIHGTLKFLGDVRESDIAALGDLLEEIARKHAPFALEIAGIGAFESFDSPRVLWAGVRGDLARYARLVADVDRVAAAFGVAPEKKDATPHLTFARVKAGKQLGVLRKRAARMIDTVFGAWPIDAIAIYKSTLMPDGSKYELLRTIRLTGTP